MAWRPGDYSRIMGKKIFKAEKNAVAGLSLCRCVSIRQACSTMLRERSPPVSVRRATWLLF